MNASLKGLSAEVTTFVEAGEINIKGILKESDTFIEELKQIESELEQVVNSGQDVAIDNVERLEKASDRWYKRGINHLKLYNSASNKYQKNIINDSDLGIDLDDAYTYRLDLENYPYEQNPEQSETSVVKKNKQDDLLKAIILHLLKIGQSDLVKDILNEYYSDIKIDELYLSRFKLLNEIVDDIVMKHDLSKALEWFKEKHDSQISANSGVGYLSDANSNTQYMKIEFKFHVLQFALLLNSGNPRELDGALKAYLYSKSNFPRFFGEYLQEISPLMTLLVLKTSKGNEEDDFTRRHMIGMLSEFTAKMNHSFETSKEQKRNKQGEVEFVGKILHNFDNVHENSSIFVNLSNEFISEYCKDMKLSSDSSLFQSILAGFVNLSSFYKYNKIQSKLSKIKDIDPAVNPDNVGGDLQGDASYSFDLPFQLPDTNRFLFKYHPIFICPVSKEQLIPVNLLSDTTLPSDVHKRKKKIKRPDEGMENPVVVLNFCQHLALKESVVQLSKKGTEIFKCHYCYKRHKLSDVSDAYFIDL